MNRIVRMRGKSRSWFWAQSEDDQIEMLADDEYLQKRIVDMLEPIADGKVKLWDASIYYHLRLALLGV